MLYVFMAYCSACFGLLFIARSAVVGLGVCLFSWWFVIVFACEFAVGWALALR